MSVTFKGDFSRVEGAVKRALNPLTTLIARDSNRYVKKDTGATESSMWSASDFPRGLIIWDTEYAAYAYYLNGALKGKNPLAEMRWFDVAKANHLSTWLYFAGKYVTREL
jgi:hypothetical protein